MDYGVIVYVIYCYLVFNSLRNFCSQTPLKRVLGRFPWSTRILRSDKSHLRDSILATQKQIKTAAPNTSFINLSQHSLPYSQLTVLFNRLNFLLLLYFLYHHGNNITSTIHFTRSISKQKNEWLFSASK